MRSTAEWYLSFAKMEVRGQSAVYFDWATGVAGDPGIRELIERMPLQKRQPNLIFAVSRLLGAPVGAYGPFRDWFVTHFEEVRCEAVGRMTQTNEPRRCASLLPALGLIDGPLALLEVGASAGLCLYPDRYSYRYNGVSVDPADGPSAVRLDSVVTGPVPIPPELPDVVWRAGIDLNPLSLDSQPDLLWLETLIWPEQDERRARLRAAIAIAQLNPPRIVRGDATTRVAVVAAEAPADATLVIMTCGVLVYLTADNRRVFSDVVRSLAARWVSLEGRGALRAVEAALPASTDPAGRFVLALDEFPLALSGPHGQSLDWF